MSYNKWSIWKSNTKIDRSVREAWLSECCFLFLYIADQSWNLSFNSEFANNIPELNNINLQSNIRDPTIAAVRSNPKRFDIQQHNIHNHLIWLPILIQSLGNVGIVDGALKLFEAMTAQGCEPSIATYNSVMCALEGQGEWMRHVMFQTDDHKRSACWFCLIQYFDWLSRQSWAVG